MAGKQRDRRQTRSSDTLVALSFQLAKTAKRARFSSIALADDLGTVIAAAGNKNVCEHMAALSPLLASGSLGPWQGAIPTDVGEVEASIAEVQIGGCRLYLSGAGGRRDSAVKVLSTSLYGVTRILG